MHEILCEECGTKYQFDTKRVPNKGYEAQCAHCGHIFFVPACSTSVSEQASSSNHLTTPLPPNEAPSSSSVEASKEKSNSDLPITSASNEIKEEKTDQKSSIQVNCKQCGMLYDFAASAIPEAGYNAQCTHCAHIFFVSGQSTLEPTPILLEHSNQNPVLPESTSRSPEPIPADKLAKVKTQNSEKVVPKPDANVESDTTKHSSKSNTSEQNEEALFTAEPIVAPPLLDVNTPLENDSQSHVASDTASDMLAIGDALGEPEPINNDMCLEDNFTRVQQNGQNRRLIAVGLLASGFIFFAFIFILKPVFLHPILGPYLGWSRPIPPASKQAYVDGLKAFKQDTASGYELARQLFTRAQKIYPQYTEALALAGLSDVFKGDDLRWQGYLLQQAGLSMEQRQTFMEKAKNKTLTKKIRRYKKNATDYRERAQLYYKEANEYLQFGLARIKKAITSDPDNPMTILMAGITYALDSEHLVQARTFSKQVSALYDLSSEHIASSKTLDTWTHFLEGLILSHDNERIQEAKRIFGMLLKSDARWQRPRFELLRLCDQNQQYDDALKWAQNMLEHNPQHPKANAYLQIRHSLGSEQPQSMSLDATSKKPRKKSHRSVRD